MNISFGPETIVVNLLAGYAGFFKYISETKKELMSFNNQNPTNETTILNPEFILGMKSSNDINLFKKRQDPYVIYPGLAISKTCSTDSDCNIIDGEHCLEISLEYISHLFSIPNKLANEIQKRNMALYYINNQRFHLGKKYCIHNSIAQVNAGNDLCNPFTGEIHIIYNKDHGIYQTKCVCKYPDFFNGKSCEDYVGCSLPKLPYNFFSDTAENKLQYAPLINKYNKRQIYNIQHFQEGDDLYETTIDGTPLYYCGCKLLNSNYTGGLIAGQCRPDPCFELRGIYENLSYQNDSKKVLGTDDQRDTRMREFECNCGDPNITRLFGGGEMPCKPLAFPEDYNNIEIGYYNKSSFVKNATCRDKKKQFIKCSNNYRFNQVGEMKFLDCKHVGYPRAEADWDNVPDAGQCVDVCTMASKIFSANNKTFDLSPCSRDSRSLGTCRNSSDVNSKSLMEMRHTYNCTDCKRNPDSKEAMHWAVHYDSYNEYCRGENPPCKIAGPCDGVLYTCCFGFYCMFGYCVPLMLY